MEYSTKVAYIRGATIAAVVIFAATGLYGYISSKRVAPPECAELEFFWRDNAKCVADMDKFKTEHPESHAEFMKEDAARRKAMLDQVFGGGK